MRAINITNLRAMMDRANHYLKVPRITLPHLELRRNGDHWRSNPGAIVATDGRRGGRRGYLYAISDANSDEMWITSACPPEVEQRLRLLDADPASVAGQEGVAVGSCCFCRLPLTDPRSRTVGYGPICAEHWGLPWGAVAPALAARREDEAETRRENAQATRGAPTIRIDLKEGDSLGAFLTRASARASANDLQECGLHGWYPHAVHPNGCPECLSEVVL